MKPDKPRVGFFADQDVGMDAVRYALETFRSHVELVVTTERNEISDLANSFDCRTVNYDDLLCNPSQLTQLRLGTLFLAWWPKILPVNLIQSVQGLIVNFHPSFLPYNRGKHYNFWTLVEDTPFGVTLHVVNEGIDTGDILFQEPIEKTWEDTGGSLYRKAKIKIIELYKEHYEDLVFERYERKRQPTGIGSFHLAREIEAESEIHLDRNYSARQLINLLRARTFEGKPACRFRDGDRVYEIRVSITEVKDASQ